MKFVYVINTRPSHSETGIEIPADMAIQQMIQSAGRETITDDEFVELKDSHKLDRGTTYISPSDHEQAVNKCNNIDEITAALDALEYRITFPDELDAWIDADEFSTYLQEQAEDKVSTGFKRLDDAIGGGLYTGMYVISGDTGLGKTTFAWQIACQIAKNTDRTVVYVTMELTTGDLVAKSITSIIGHGDIKDNDETKKALATFKSSVGNRLHVKQDGFGLESDHLIRYMERYDRPIVFVDYLQALTPSGKFYDMRNAIDSAVHALRDYCKEHRAIMIVLSSLNRTSYGKGASMAALKESGGIEYTADCVIGLQLRCVEETDYVNAKTDEERAQLLDAEIGRKVRRITAKVLKARKAAPKARVYYNYQADISKIEESDEDPKPVATKTSTGKKDEPVFGTNLVEVFNSLENFAKASGEKNVKLAELAPMIGASLDRARDKVNDSTILTVETVDGVEIVTEKRSKTIATF